MKTNPISVAIEESSDWKEKYLSFSIIIRLDHSCSNQLYFGQPHFEYEALEFNLSVNHVDGNVRKRREQSKEKSFELDSGFVSYNKSVCVFVFPVWASCLPGVPFGRPGSIWFHHNDYRCSSGRWKCHKFCHRKKRDIGRVPSDQCNDWWKYVEARWND